MRILEEINSVVKSSLLFISAEQSHALERMHTCRTVECGGRIVQCPNCYTRTVVFNPCNQRGCPICSKRNQILWKQKVEKKLLPVSHYHLVFSIPRAYTLTWLRNKRAVINVLFKSVSRVIGNIRNDKGLLAGSILVFQSHGRGMCYKPHIHCILSAGGIGEDKTWKEIGSLPYKQMQEEFRCLAYKELSKTIGSDRLPDTKEIDNNEWKVYPEYHQGNGKSIVGYLSHTSCGSVINLKQDFMISGNSIRFTETHDGKVIETELEKKTFVERYLNHIPPEGVVSIRYYGLYSNQHSEELKEIRKSFPKEIEVIVEESVIDKCPECESRMFTLIVFPPNTSIEYIEIMLGVGPPNKSRFRIL